MTSHSKWVSQEYKQYECIKILCVTSRSIFDRHIKIECETYLYKYFRRNIIYPMRYSQKILFCSFANLISDVWITGACGASISTAYDCAGAFFKKKNWNEIKTHSTRINKINQNLRAAISCASTTCRICTWMAKTNKHKINFRFIQTP